MQDSSYLIVPYFQKNMLLDKFKKIIIEKFCEYASMCLIIKYLDIIL